MYNNTIDAAGLVVLAICFINMIIDMSNTE